MSVSKIGDAVKLFFISFGIRIIFIIVGEILDSKFGFINYTDVDYFIFSDAARLVYMGQSPYERSTYRYPPLLAILLIPNQWILCFGKVLFSLLDSALAVEIMKCSHILSTKKSTKTRVPSAITCAYLWAFNPIAINICTRGSADSLTNYLVLLVLRLILSCKLTTVTGCIYGFLVYMRIYPIIYCPALFIHLIASKYSAVHNYRESASTDMIRKTVASNQNLHDCQLTSDAGIKSALYFLISAFFTVVLLVLVSYSIYGYDYLDNAILYHLSREDHRHNFSVHFYWIYLCKSRRNYCSRGLLTSLMEYLPDFSGMTGGLHEIIIKIQEQLDIAKDYLLSIDNISLDSIITSVIFNYGIIATTIESVIYKLLLFAPQLLTSIAVTRLFAVHNLPVCLLLLTMIFVAYNKVITAQYFTWYLCIVPVALPFLFPVQRSYDKHNSGMDCQCGVVSTKQLDSSSSSSSVTTNSIADVTNISTLNNDNINNINIVSNSSCSACLQRKDNDDDATSSSSSQLFYSDASTVNNQTVVPMTMVMILLLLLCWCTSLALWLYSAYQLEFLGHNNYQTVWLCSLLFHCANVALIGALIYKAPVSV